jgi:hypothetical protein
MKYIQDENTEILSLSTVSCNNCVFFLLVPNLDMYETKSPKTEGHRELLMPGFRVPLR